MNAAIEDLVRKRYELPAFGTLLKIARTARALVNRGYHRRIAAAIRPEGQGRLNALLAVPEGAARSPWDQVKAEPPRPSPQRMREYIVHLRWLRAQAVDGAFAGVPDQKLRQFAAEAKTAQRRRPRPPGQGKAACASRRPCCAGRPPRRSMTLPRCSCA